MCPGLYITKSHNRDYVNTQDCDRLERFLLLSSKSNITETLTWLETGINLNSGLVFLHLMVSIKLNGEHHPYFFKVFSIEIFMVLFTESISQEKKKKKEPQDYKKSPVNIRVIN